MRCNRLIIFLISFSFLGCSVGTKVNLTANSLDYPVSQSSAIYAPNGEILYSETYTEISDFELNFKKWGVSSVIEIQSDTDISDQLNEIIESKGGDGIVNLQISMRNTGANSFMLFIKSVALMGSIIATGITLLEPSSDSAAIAAGSIFTYIFTPGNADIEITGTVIKFSN